MTMTARGLAKLIEECGELTQVAGKKLAYYNTDEHPDGGPPLSVRLEDEIADVRAACELVERNFNLNRRRITIRTAEKFSQFLKWDADPYNNTNGVDFRNKIDNLSMRVYPRDEGGRG